MSGARHRSAALGGHRVPWVLAGIVIAASVLAAAWNTSDPLFDLLSVSAIASTALVGALLMTRAPGNRVGVLLLAAATLLAASALSGAYSVAAKGPPGPQPLGVGLASMLNDVFFIPPLVILLIGIPLIFPDGHLLSRRWSAAAWLTVAAIVALTLSKLFGPGSGGPAKVDNPLAIPGLEPVLGLLGAFSTLTAPIGFGAAVAAVAIRFRRGHGIERQQLKWFLAVVGICAISFLVSFLPLDFISWVAFAIAFCGLIAMPIAIAIAILRYRLYEIDRLVSRTIAYATVTGGLVVVYLVVNLALSTAFSALASGNSVAVAASTLAVAALFTPLRRRVQHVVDHRFDRARYDAERTTAAFSERLRNEVDLAAVAADLDDTVRAAIAPTSIGIWLRAGER